MLTNTTPITVMAPFLSQQNIDKIIERIKKLHENLSDDGASEYLCELLAIEKLSDISCDFLLYQEVEPAVSSEELHLLAERVLPYNNNNMDRAIYSVRNILNTIPRRVDDLEDYVTSERKREFIENICSRCLSTIPIDTDKIQTLHELKIALKAEPEISLNIACNEEMNYFQSVPVADNGCITERQNLLCMAGNYFMNHKIGFECNTMWLAIFTAPQFFGCASGWIHPNGDLCNGRHFGFKDTKSLPNLVIDSSNYVEELLDKTLDEIKSNGKSESSDTANLYLQTILFAIDELMKQSIQDLTNNKIVEEISDLLVFIEDYEELLEDHQRLLYLVLGNIYGNEDDFMANNFDAMKNIMARPDAKGPPVFSYSWFYDSWNFLILEVHANIPVNLAGLFIGARYSEDCLYDFSANALNLIQSRTTPEQLRDILIGFFKHYIWIMINENSDTHSMFDAYLEISIKANDIIDVSDNIRFLAELGHKQAIMEHMKTAQLSDKEALYWTKRAELAVDLES